MQRARGFTLFIAVCNSPATARKLIDLLRDSMPGSDIETAELYESTEDPLRDVTSRLMPGKRGPVMILGLERSCPSSAPYHPVLHVLNLQRPEWPKELPRPVVLWVPEYLLSLLGREAPDFLDWRSDTLFFPFDEDAVRNLIPIWFGGLDGSMPEAQRRARVEELQSRLRSTSSAEDLVVLSARSNWLTELGNHLYLLGDLEGAETAFRDSLAIETSLGRDGGVATAYSNLGSVEGRRGRLERTTEWLKQAINMFDRAGDAVGMATAQTNLAAIYLDRDDFSTAEELLLKALKLHDSISRPGEMATVCLNLALLYWKQDQLDKAEDLLQQGIRLSKQVGDLLSMAAHYRVSAGIHVARGDYNRAEELVLKSLSIDERFAYREGMAEDLALLGILYKARGNMAEAREALEKARALYESLGIEGAVQGIDASLESLSDPG